MPGCVKGVEDALVRPRVAGRQVAGIREHAPEEGRQRENGDQAKLNKTCRVFSACIQADPARSASVTDACSGLAEAFDFHNGSKRDRAIDVGEWFRCAAELFVNQRRVEFRFVHV